MTTYFTGATYIEGTNGELPTADPSLEFGVNIQISGTSDLSDVDQPVLDVKQAGATAFHPTAPAPGSTLQITLSAPGVSYFDFGVFDANLNELYRLTKSDTSTVSNFSVNTSLIIPDTDYIFFSMNGFNLAFNGGTPAFNSVSYNLNVTGTPAAAATPHLSMASATFTEANSSYTAHVGIDADVAYDTDYQITITFDDGTAKRGSDYASPSQTLMMPAHQTHVDASVTIMGDTIPELDEDFTIHAATQFGTAGTIITIKDDDGPFTYENIVASVLASAAGSTFAEKVHNAASDIIGVRVNNGTTNTVYRDAEYYIDGLDAALNKNADINTLGVLLAPVYSLIKGVLAEVGLGLRADPNHPNSPPGGIGAAWSGLLDGYTSDGAPPPTVWVRENQSSGNALSDSLVRTAAISDSSLYDPNKMVLVDGAANTSGTPATIVYDYQYGVALQLTGSEGYVFGGDGNNIIIAGQGAAYINGLGGDDQITGGSSSDVLDGGAGNDALSGNSGNDFLIGDAGQDTLRGGAGSDKFVFDATALADAQSGAPIFDRIVDFDQGNAAHFSAAEGDQIDISAITGTAFDGGQTAGALARVVEDPSNAHVLLQVDADGTANGIAWTTIAQLDGIHGGDTVNAVLSTAQSSGAPLSVMSNDARFGDFDGDGKADLIWRNDNGSVATWQMGNGAVPTGHFLVGASADWHIVGTGDFNADGKSDVLWLNDNGALLDWQMTSSSLVGSTLSVGSAPGNSALAGIGDVDHDGKSDLLWRNISTGAVTINTAAGASSTISTVGNDWSVVGIGDFNGDGKADVMFRNEGLGVNATWLMNGTTVASTVFLPGVPNDWHVVGTGDFDGNGTTDLFWHNDGGANAVWLMNTSGGIQQAGFFDGVGPDWHVAGTGDFNGDTRDDVMWRSDGGATAIWQMNGAGTPTVSFPGGVPTDWATQAHHYEYV